MTPAKKEVQAEDVAENPEVVEAPPVEENVDEKDHAEEVADHPLTKIAEDVQKASEAEQKAWAKEQAKLQEEEQEAR